MRVSRGGVDRAAIGFRETGIMMLVLLGSFLPAAAQPYGMDQRPPVSAFLNGVLPKAESTPSGWQAVEAFPNITFNDPVSITPEPRTNRLYVSERQGKIFHFPNISTTTNKTLFLDLSATTQGYNDCGLVGFAFHPEFGISGSTNRGYVYVYRSYSPSPVGGPLAPEVLNNYCRLSRFTVPDGALVADPNSEMVLINQFDRHLGHPGGGMFFGPDGFLFLSIGDEGGIGDPYQTAQKVNGGLFSGVIRIDVNQDPTKSHPIRRQPVGGATPPNGWPPTYSSNYFIPNDNPWLKTDGSVLEEYWALGLRSPHRMTYDAVSDRIWVGEVGQASWEEVDIIEKGGNYQWAYQEGLNPGFYTKPIPIIGVDKPPVHNYAHANGNTCVIGGYVYRGSSNSALYGKYIFGDNGSGRIWAMTYDGVNPATVTELCVMPAPAGSIGLGSFGLDQNNELFMSVVGPNTHIYALAPVGVLPPPPPALLSQTGVFTNLATLEPNPALIPFSVNTPLWSDNATKSRWMAVPTNGLIGYTVSGNWTFPIGTVLVKHFELPTNDTNPAVRKRLETRFLVNATNGSWYGLTYKWRADNSDADLLPGELNETNLIVTATGVRTQVWYYPSRQDCRTCHTANSGNALGPRTSQFNGTNYYPATGVSDNQLRTLNHIGMFNTNLVEASIPALPQMVSLTNESASLELRVRSYLQANCAHCHQPGGAQAVFDARFSTPLANQGLVNGTVLNNLGIANARIIKPQSTAESILHVRDNAIGANQMPPLAKNVVDTSYINVLGQWINSLAPVAPPAVVGNTNNGTLIDDIGAGWINAGRFQAVGDLTVTTMYAKVVAISGGYKCAIYSDSGGQPSRLLKSSAEVSNPTTGWQAFALTAPQALTNGQFYWLAIWSGSSGAQVYYSGTTGSLRWGQYAYGTWPDPIVAPGSGNGNYCIYAEGMAASLTSLSVTPINPSLTVGATQQFVALGTYSDGSTLNVTSQATWTTSNLGVATINASGLATGVAAGSTTITVALSGLTGNTTLTVQPAALTITTTSLPNGAVNATYAATMTASGGNGNYTWSLASGLLPPNLTLNAASGAILGTPAIAGTSNFIVQVSDTSVPVQSTTKALSITVTPVNAAPVANADSYSLAAGVTLNVSAPGVLGNDTDADGNNLKALLVSGVSHGTINLFTNGSFTYSPTSGYSGPDAFSYKANDGNADSGVATVNLTIDGGSVNHYDFTYADRASLLSAGWDFLARTAAGATRNTEQTNGALVDYNQATHPGVLRIPVDTGDLWAAANDTRNSLFRTLPGDWTSIRLKVSFAPTQNFQQVGLLVYQDDDNYLAMTRLFNDGQQLFFVREFGGSAADLVGAAVTATTNLHLRMDRDVTTGVIAGLYSLNGTNWIAMGSGVTQTLNNPRLGILTGASPGGFPNADLAWAEIIVTQATLVNDPPVLVNDSANTQEDVSVTVGVLANDSDPEGMPLVITGTTTTNGTAIVSGTNVVFTPSTNFNGTVVFSYIVSDGTNTATANVTVTVSPVNDVPVAVNQTVVTPANVSTNLVLSGSDVDSLNLTYALVAGPAHGSLGALNATNGVVTYSPTGNYSGPDSFTFMVSDGSLSATGQVSFTVAAVLTSIAVTPASPSLLSGGTLQLTATGTYSDASTQNVTSLATWTSSSNAVATVSVSGLATGIAAGTASVSAALASQTGSTTLTILPPPVGLGDYRSVSSGVWSDATVWQTNNGTAWFAATQPPTNATTAGVITVQNGHLVTVTAAVTVDQVVVATGGQITVNTGQTLTLANGMGTDLSVSGILQNAGTITLGTSASLAFNAGGTYQHNLNAGTIPPATWAAASTCLITGTTTTLPGSLAQAFGHFTWNCASQTASLNLETNLSTAGNFTVSSTGTGTLRLLNSTTARTLTVGGNYNQSGGTFVLKNNSGVAILNVAGNFNQTGGTFTLRSGSTTGTGTVNVTQDFKLSVGTFNLSGSGAVGTLNVGGNFAHTGGTLTETSTGSGAVIFTAGMHTNTSGGTVANTINYTVNSGATLMLGTSLLGNGSSGTFTLTSGGTLGIGDPVGITTSGATGNIRVTGTRSFNTGANYIYNGTAAQVPGNGLPATVNNLTVGNAAGLTVNTTNTVNGTCLVDIGGRLLGTGRIDGGPLLLNGTVAPGVGVGRFTTAGQTWNGGASYHWEINNATGAPGTGWDLLSLTNGQGIHLQAASTNPVTVKLITLNGSNPGPAANFNKTNSYVWTLAIATNAAVTNFAADKFVVDATQFSNDFSGGTFSVEQLGSELRLKFAAVPTAPTITAIVLPNGVQSTAYSGTLAAIGGIAPYNWSISSGFLPTGLALNSTSGVISGLPTGLGNFNFTVQVSDASNPIQSASKALSITITPVLTAIAVTPANPGLLTGGTQQFTATGTYSDSSTSNITTQVAWSSANPGVATVSASGLATGISAGATLVSAGLAGVTGSTLLTVQAPLVVTTVSLPNGTVSTAYTTTLTASGGNGSYTWSLVSGALPSGLTLNVTSGAIAGTPTVAGTSNITVQVTDASIPVKAATKALSITVMPVLSSIAVTPLNPSITVGGTQQFVATGTYSDGSTQNLSSQATWSSSSLAVATINASGLATGVSTGSTTITASLGGKSGNTTLTVQPAPVAITTTSLPNGTVSTVYAATLTASGGTSPYSWSLASGVLPAGLVLNGTSGAVTGTPTTAGTFSFAAQVTDAGSPAQSVTKAMSVVVSAVVTAAVGNTNNGTLIDDIGAGWINAGRFQAVGDLTVTTMYAKVVAISGGYKCAIYSDSGGQPSRLLKSSAEVSNPTTGWQAFALTAPQALTNGQFYWLAIWSGSSGAQVYYSGTTGSLRWGQYAYGTWPDPIVAPGSGNGNYCIYATGTAPAFAAAFAGGSAPQTRTSPLEQPAILSIGVTNMIVTITSTAVPGHRYVLEYVKSLGDSDWLPVATPVVASGSTLIMTDAMGDSSRRFYRVLNLAD